ncbi:MAG: hypothetical protein HN981_03470 [Candidatus Pacebacteria bacterium]|jgi:hypothetical protein|nr:hypothetical protein [Candidatus Paceibacterota bacterium]MBT4652250.1 hypothetical protein [Candidatus Paceibacterota bacterium]MBT6756662.1 hypothetical protein [Candidatus Paceibacterota bacterium]MBT6921422.1 hypothetical protein [Candidatus Paceibacterota bacterium]
MNIQKNNNLLKITNKIYEKIASFYEQTNLKNWEYLLIIMIGLSSFIIGEQIKLKKEFAKTQQIAQTLAKKTGLKIYSPQELSIKQIGDVYVQIPNDWTNIMTDYITDGGIRKHYIASFGDDFSIPFSSEYAFIVAVEKRGVTTDLETFLKNNAVSSDPNQEIDNYVKVNDEMFYILREDVGKEYFRKVDDVIMLIFVYDNGDRIIDDFEQRFINSVGPVEKDTLFDYK